MKAKYIFTCLILTGTFLGSCKKDTGVNSTGVSLNIVNAMDDAPSLALNFSPTGFTYSQNKTFVYNQSGTEFSLPSGSNTFNLTSSTDTVKALFQGKLNLTAGGIYSFYVAGQVAHYDTLLMKDKIPSYGADSVASARFINLASDSQPLSINLVGNATPDFSGLAYKKITVFKKYPATMDVTNNGGYTYEIRDASGNVLTTFNWSPSVFKNNTLVITGLVGTGSVSVFPVNNY